MCTFAEREDQLYAGRWVSIPFKRESTCALCAIKNTEELDEETFPFPSNGKAHVHKGYSRASVGRTVR